MLLNCDVYDTSLLQSITNDDHLVSSSINAVIDNVTGADRYMELLHVYAASAAFSITNDTVIHTSESGGGTG